MWLTDYVADDDVAGARSSLVRFFWDIKDRQEPHPTLVVPHPHLTRQNMYTVLTLVFLSLAVAANAQSPPVETRSMAEIYQAALAEGRTLRVSWGGDIRLCGSNVAEAFQNAFPGITVDLTCDLSKYLDGRINRRLTASGNTDAGVDVAVIQTLHNFPLWKAQNLLLNYKPLNWDDVHSEFVDADGAYTGLFISTFGPILYNPSQYQESDLPSTYPDFLASQWTNQIILTYPDDDDAVLYLFTLISSKYTFSFVNELKAQNTKWVRGSATPALYIADNNVASDARSISFAAHTGFTTGLRYKLPTDPYMAWPQTGAIFANTQAPETAKLFLNFLLSDEYQRTVNGFGFATRTTFDTSGILNQTNVNPLGFAQFMSDRALVERWRQSFEDYIGTPQGVDPVQTTAFDVGS